MNSLQTIQSVLGEPSLALVGLSRDPASFGAMTLPRLRDAGYRLIAVHPAAASVQGIDAVPSLDSLGAPVGAAVFFTRPEVTDRLLPEAAAAGIRKVWVQQGAEGPGTQALCDSLGLEAVTRQCLLMFAGKVDGYHKFHRTLKGWFGGLPR